MCALRVAHAAHLPHSKSINWNWLRIYFVFQRTPCIIECVSLSLFLCVCVRVCFVCTLAFTWSPCVYLWACWRRMSFPRDFRCQQLGSVFPFSCGCSALLFYSLLSGCFTRFACLSLLGSNSCWHCVAASASAAAVVRVVIVFHFYNHFYVLELLMGFASWCPSRGVEKDREREREAEADTHT